MEKHMAGVAAVDEQHSWLLNQYLIIVSKSEDFGLKVDEMHERILVLKRERRKMLGRHEKISEASNLLELLSKAFQSANQKMREGIISTVKEEWDNLKRTPGNQDICPMTMLIERIRKISIETVKSKEFPQCVGLTSQQGARCLETTKFLAAEIILGMQFSPAIAILEDDLINQNKILRLERSQLEERVKRTLASFARIKLDLSKFENECHRLHNVLHRNKTALLVPNVMKMISDIREIEKKNTAMLCRWQHLHNALCGVLEDVRIFNTQAVKDSEKIWYLCRSCKQLNLERVELMNQLVEKNPQGDN